MSQDVQALVLNGDEHLRRGEVDMALGLYAQALQAQPKRADILFRLAKILLTKRQARQALAMLRVGLALEHDSEEACAMLGEIWRDHQAELNAEDLVSLGDAFRRAARPALSLEAFIKAGDDKAAIFGQGLALRMLGRLDEARGKFERATELGVSTAPYALACLDLLEGDFERGWEGFQARGVEGARVEDIIAKRFPFPSLHPHSSARRILIVGEDWLGDTLQFVRYLPLMREAGFTPYLFTQPRMQRILTPIAQGRVITENSNLPPLEAQISLASLPALFQTRVDTIPANVPYLFAEADLIPRWAAEIGGQGFRIGCAWQGNITRYSDCTRSFRLAELAPVAAVPGVRLISLQKGPGEEQARNFNIMTLSPDFDAGGDAFIDTAAAMMSLDLIITCDTAIAHLAGALGRPVWVALTAEAEWRWLRHRADSPWYPTMRLFRQKYYGDWASVFAEMTSVLQGNVRV